MSASRPGSVMLRAATAASGGTGAPDWTYCSIWPWTRAHQRLDLEALRARRPAAARRAPRWTAPSTSKPSRRRRCWPWTMARTVPSWSWTTWAILASVPTAYSSDGSVDVLALGLALGDQGDGRAVGDGLVEGLDRLLAADLEGHDHLREDDRLAQGDERQGPERAPVRRPARSRGSSAFGWALRLAGSAGHGSPRALVRDGPASAGRCGSA